jgi:hypothetical protein
MTIRAFLAAVALTTPVAGVASAQQPPQEGYEAPQEGYEAAPQQGSAPPPQQYAPPPGYAPPPEQAPPPVALAANALGAVGQIAISDDLLLSASRSTQSFMGQSASSTDLLLQPALDFFVAPNLSIGGQVRLGVSSSNLNGDNSTKTIGLLPRIGYNIPIGPIASIWPRASLAYVHYSNSTNGGAYSTSSYTASFILFVPVLFQPAPHFFIGGGPYLSADLISKFEAGGTSTDTAKTTSFGLMSTVGGHFGGT